MLNLPRSLFTKVGAYEVMRTNLTNLPVDILPDQSYLIPATGKEIDSIGLHGKCPLPTINSDTFSFSVEVSQVSWSAPSGDTELFSVTDAAVENGFRVYQADSTGYLTVDFLDNTTKKVTLSYDISGASSGVHNLMLSRVPGAAQKLYWDSVLVDSDTVSTDTIGTPAAATDNISAISKAVSAEVTTSSAHGLDTGDLVTFSSIVGSQTNTMRRNKGMESLNTKKLTITKIDATKFTIPINSTHFDTYVSSGVISYTPSMGLSSDVDVANILLTLNLLDANDTEILYQMVRNNLVVRDENGLIKVVTIV